MKEEEIKTIIVKVIKEKLKVSVSFNEFLLGGKIAPEEFLYVVVELEDVYKLPITKVIFENKFDVLTVNNLAHVCLNS